MSNSEIKAALDTNLFNRWKENFKDFFIEDDQKVGTKKLEEKESLIEPKGDPKDENLEQEKNMQSMSAAQEDLEGISEVEEEMIKNEILENTGGDEKNENESIQDSQRDNKIVIDDFTNDEGVLIQEKAQEQENINHQSKAPLFKILANFPFLKKKSSEVPAATEEQAPPADSTETNETNCLLFHSEVIDQQEEHNDKVTNTKSKEIPTEKEDDSKCNAEEIDCDAKDKMPTEDCYKTEIGTNRKLDEDEQKVPDNNVEETVDLNIPHEFNETKKDEKKLRFRFQFFSNRK